MTRKRILFVCTGNICRSPAAEGMFRKMLYEAGLEQIVAVDSAGTHAYRKGAPPDANAIKAAQKRGVDIGGLTDRTEITQVAIRLDGFSWFRSHSGHGPRQSQPPALSLSGR